MRAVVFDAMGVLYASSDDVAELLIPFAHQHGSSLTAAEIAETYRRASLGEMMRDELWLRLGVAGDPNVLDGAYLSAHRLTPGIADLLDELVSGGVGLGCISNDVSAWSRWLRTRHDLQRRIGVWTISADVGARKPDARIYRAFLAQSGYVPEEVVFVDDRPSNVDAASEIGFRTVLVDFGGVAHDSRHRIREVRDLAAVLRSWQ